MQVFAFALRLGCQAERAQVLVEVFDVQGASLRLQADSVADFGRKARSAQLWPATLLAGRGRQAAACGGGFGRDRGSSAPAAAEDEGSSDCEQATFREFHGERLTYAPARPPNLERNWPFRLARSSRTSARRPMSSRLESSARAARQIWPVQSGLGTLSS